MKREGADAAAPAAKKAKASGDEDKKAFLTFYKELVAELIEAEKQSGQMSYAVDWLQRMTDYNVPHGKLNRGLAVLDGVRAIKGDACTPELEKQAMVAGWAIEWLQAFFLVADDIMDASKTRRGQPCWYLVEDVGMNAVNDGIVLEACMYKMLKKHLGKLPCYANILELFHDVTYATANGQMIDVITAPIGVVDLSKYTIETYMRIVTYKTALYTFYLPAASAMYLCGIDGEEEHALAKDICIQLGQYFQIQDDFLDCFGDPKVIGKIGTDIEDNKCSWLIVQALDRATPEQRQVFQDNYGQSDEAKVEKIKEVYRALDMPKIFSDYEEASYKKLSATIEGQDKLPKGLFSAMLQKIYKRSK